MQIQVMRNEAIGKAISDIKQLLSKEVSVETLNAAKIVLLALAERKELFPRSDFPIPSEEQVYRTFLVHEDSDGTYALYVNSSLPEQSSRPHDHSGSWAIIVAVEGEETHQVYKTPDNPRSSGEYNIKLAGKIVVKPGTAISLMPEGIHSIHAESEEPLLHLHLYGLAFQRQNNRKEYDLAENTVREFVLEDLGFIEDAR